jgi:hypothetical protein
MTTLLSSCSSVNGINSALGTIQTSVWIALTEHGAVAGGYGSLFPNAEVWMYGTSEGPTLLVDFQTQYLEPVIGLSQTGSF